MSLPKKKKPKKPKENRPKGKRKKQEVCGAGAGPHPGLPGPAEQHLASGSLQRGGPETRPSENHGAELCVQTPFQDGSQVSCLLEQNV